MIKVRANKISIETPKEGSEPWIRVEVQRVEKIGDVHNVQDHFDSFNYRLSDVADQKFPIMMDTSVGFVTAADIGTHLTFAVINWLAQRYNGTIDSETGDVIIEA